MLIRLVAGAIASDEPLGSPGIVSISDKSSTGPNGLPAGISFGNDGVGAGGDGVGGLAGDNLSGRGKGGEGNNTNAPTGGRIRVSFT